MCRWPQNGDRNMSHHNSPQPWSTCKPHSSCRTSHTALGIQRHMLSPRHHASHVHQAPLTPGPLQGVQSSPHTPRPDQRAACVQADYASHPDIHRAQQEPSQEPARWSSPRPPPPPRRGPRSSDSSRSADQGTHGADNGQLAFGNGALGGRAVHDSIALGA